MNASKRSFYQLCIPLFLALAGIGLCQPTAPQKSEELNYELFRDPAPETRPFVRWWWNGGRVNAGEIKREIELLHQSGIGGVEINTIAMDTSGTIVDPSLARHPAVNWLSPEWIQLVRSAAAECKQRGMTTDLIVGSGWPFGARFLLPEEQTQRVLLAKREIHGPMTLKTSVEELTHEAITTEKKKEKSKDIREPTASELLFLRLLPAKALSGDYTPGTEHATKKQSDGSITVDVPAGDYLLYAGTRQIGFTHVKLGAPGADGPVVDHFNAAAVRRYLDAMSGALNAAIPGGMRTAIRATFVDSLELDHANWTGDLPAEFLRRRGYDIMPYLPFVLDPPVSESKFSQAILRARYDFDLTITELFEERFTGTYVAWAAANGVKARMQAYGRESHPLHGSMAVDFPEGESWLWMADVPRRIRVESTVINKYVASAANLTGQRLRSFEAMTNAVPVFRATLENFKQGMDLSILSGVNHPILHGFNYSPPDAGYPGWMRFGSYINEHNPWWKHFKLFTDYAARIGTVMRHSDAQAKIAVLAPRPEEWAHHGLLYQPFPEVPFPWYQYCLMEAIHQTGRNADYISERILTQGSTANGKLCFGPRAYDTIILEDVAWMEPAAATGLANFAKAGGKVVIIGSPPGRSPGMASSSKNDAQVSDLGKALESLARGSKAKVFQFTPPGPEELLSWTARMLQETGVESDVTFDVPRPDISQVYHRDGERAIYFLVNTNPKQAVDLNAAFPAGRGTAWEWDLQSGERRPLSIGQGNRLDLHFGALESKLLVFDPKTENPATLPVTETSPGKLEMVTLKGPWSVKCHVGGSEKVFDQPLKELEDLSLNKDPQLRDFGGTLVYRLSFEAPPSEAISLDLGHINGTSKVLVNGKPIGTRWWGRHLYHVDGMIKPGSNSLEIEVTTILANQMRSMKDNATAQRWAFWAPPIEMGLIGPVQLGCRPKIEGATSGL